MKHFFLVLASLAFASLASAQVVVSEIHYHPVEEPTFNADGTPVLDLSNDVHEFVEIQNAGTSAVDLSGWKLAGGVSYAFPSGASIAAGGFKVIAKTPARIESVYGLTAGSVLGPYGGFLSNHSDTVRVQNAAGDLMDAVSYQSRFPWTSAADALGAQDRFLGITASAYNFKGRSLQRVSVTWPSSDPANWLASPLTPGPSPGAAQAVTRTVPKPVVIAQGYAQATDGAAIVRASNAVTVNCTFSSPPGATVPLGAVTLESFLDGVNSTTETRSTVAMTDLGNGKYTANLPGQVDRSVVRYRIRANRGDGLETVSPRPDDPQIAPIGAGGARETWWGYCVTPVRTATNPVYDILVGTSALTQMNANITQTPKRVTAANAAGIPRDAQALADAGQTVTATTPLWDGTQPGIFACNGQVWDIQIRYHGSMFHRAAANNSFKLHFPDNNPFNDQSAWFETGHGAEFIEAQKLNRLLGLPSSKMRTVDWYYNANAKITRSEQGEYGKEMLDAYHELQQQLNPGSAKEESGDLYKVVGNRDVSQNNLEGPYTKGDEAPLVANSRWTQLQRYDWTFNLQSNHWKGPMPIRDMVETMWTKRGDTPAATTLASNATNLAATKAWFTANFDVETTLTSLALLEWMAVWDDVAHNQFFWRRASGKWVRLGWDYDQVIATNRVSQSIYNGEAGNSSFDGTNWWKDTFIKCFRAELNQRIWELNNSFLDPANLTANGFSTAVTFANSRQSYINNQLSSLGTYAKPARPTNATPAAGATVVGATNLTTSAYSHPAAVAQASTKWEIRTATGNYEEPVLRLTSTTNRTSLPVPFEDLTYGQTYYWRATHFDANGHASVVSAESSFTWGTVSNTAGTLVINEVLAFNRNALANGGDYPDYIELRNNGTTAVNVGGYTLTDDPLVPAKYTIPNPTTIPAGGYQLFFADSATSSPGLHTGFGLDSDGDQVLLLNGGAIVDSVTFGPQAPDLSIGRITNGTGGWQANSPTPGAANSAKTLGSVASLRVNEWMANPAYGEDWFEIYNADGNPVALAGLYLSDTPATPTITAIPALSFIAGKSHAKFWADGLATGGNHCNFKLSNSGESLVITQANGTTALDAVTFSAQTKDVSQGRLPDGGSTIVPFPATASPGYTNWAPSAVYVNEVLANGASPFEDAIEIYNPTASAVSIGGWWLSDDFNVRQKYQIPAGTTVPAGGYFVVYEAQLLAGSVPFSLGARGDEVLLSAVDGTAALTGYGSLVRFGASGENVSFGRVAATGLNPSAGGAEFWRQTAHTFGQDNATAVATFRTGTGAANGGPAIGPVTINEIMYHPVDGTGGADTTTTEFIELFNPTGAAVDLGGWRVRGDTEFTFPAGISLAANAYALVVSFDPGDATALAAFRGAYGLGAATPIYGPYSEKLSNGTFDVEIARPVTLGGVSTFVNVDKVEYRDGSPWPTSPDGTGKSLQRASSGVIGNTAANWTGNAPTPGAINVGVTSALAVSTASPLPGGAVGTAYAATLAATGGTTPYAWSLVSGSIPGLALATDGTFNGNPTAAGTYALTVQVADATTATASKSLSLTIAATNVSITTAATLPGGSVNSAYSAALIASGGTAPYAWSLGGGSLPGGLTLGSGGAITGTPTASGAFSFTTRVTDANGLSTTQSLALTISALPLAITSPSTLPAGTYGGTYSQALTATGGTAPYVWSLGGGSLPAGLTLNGTGDLDGTPTMAGTFTFVAQVTDAAQTVLTKSLSLNVSTSPLAVATTSLPLAIHGEVYSQTLVASGGVEPYAWSISAGSPPSGITLNGATLGGITHGTGAFAFAVKVSDGAGTSATQTLTLNAAASGPLDHYAWSFVPTVAYSGVPFAVKVTGRDDNERLVANAANAVTLTATSGNATTSPVLITELTDGAEKQFELQNVTAGNASTTGWFVLVSDDPNDINSVNAVTFPLPTAMAAGSILRVSEQNVTTGGRTYFGGPINWSSSTGKTWIMLFDADSKLRDFVVTGWTAADLATFSVEVNGEGVSPGSQWQGNGAAAGTRAPGGTLDGWQRTGTRDRGTAADWTWRHDANNGDATSFGATNAGLTLPWADTVAVAVTPASITLGNGGYLGNVTVAQSGGDLMLAATDADGHAGSSSPFTVLSGVSTAGDGIPDAWKLQYGFSPAANVAALDADGDGATNLDEYLAGTNPLLSTSKLGISAASGPAAGKFTVSWPGVAGKLYRVSTSPDLVTWTPQTPLVFVGASGMQTTALDANNQVKLFVRIEVAPYTD